MAESHSAKKKRSLIHNYFVEVDGAVTIKKIVPLMSEWLQCHVLSKRNQFADRA